jgi:toluene monooxygenase system protein D
MAVLDVDDTEPFGPDFVGPVVRSGTMAEAVIDAVADDNPGRDVLVVDRDDYVRIHTARECRLTQASLQKHLGQPYQLAALEIDMPSFKGRLRTRTDEYVWFYTR